MGERKRELKVFLVEYVCDECGRGTMEYSGKGYNGYGVITNDHYCSECNELQEFDKWTKYPKRIYRPADEGTTP